MKNLSLQDQLLKAGLTNETKAKKIRSDKRKLTKKQQKNKIEIVDEAKQLLEDAKAKQLEKDICLNQQRDIEANKKQIANQILQLIELNKLSNDEDGIAYNFTDHNKVKAIYISEDNRNKIITGSLAIVKSKDKYEVIPAEVAEKIKQRDDQTVIVLFEGKTVMSENDEYKGYEIPDDLIW